MRRLLANAEKVAFGGGLQVRGPFGTALNDIRSFKWLGVHHDVHAWQTSKLANLPVAHGVTLTPYANTQRCTAHCHYCSEELKRLHEPRPNAHVKNLIGDQDLYFSQLAECFAWLEAAGVRVGLSLSGLEATADSAWLRRLLRLADDHSPLFTERVLYSNGTGLLTEPELAAGLDRVEIHRDHRVEETNQKLMRLERRVAVRANDQFARMVAQITPLVKDGNTVNVCILSREGVGTLEAARAHAAWARDVGFRGVIFRELSRISPADFELDGGDRTAQWVETNRVPLDDILRELSNCEPDRISVGYYYYNEIFEDDAFWGEPPSHSTACEERGTFTVTLECSCYDALREQTSRDEVHKVRARAYAATRAPPAPARRRSRHTPAATPAMLLPPHR